MPSKKHNKRRNTGFLYEALVRELTKASLERQDKKKQEILQILKEFFGEKKILGQELGLYNTLTSVFPNREQAIAATVDVKTQRRGLSDDDIFREQSRLIRRINRDVSSDVFKHFVPNYRNLATVAQILSPVTKTKTRVLLESQHLDNMVEKSEEGELVPHDTLVYKTYLKKFNEKYSNAGLLREQQELLGKYIVSFVEGGIDFKVYINEELTRLKKTLKESLKLEEISSDEEMTEKTKQVVAKIEEYREHSVDKLPLNEILDIQQLVHEIDLDEAKNGDND